jgi:hypothetical protein
MKSTFTIACTVLLMASASAFAAGQAPAPAAPTAAAPMAAAGADMKAQKKQIRLEKKTALKACKTMNGAEKSTCQKAAKDKEMAAMADLKAAK